MTDKVVFFKAALVQIAFLAALKDALVVVPAIIFLVDLQVLLQVGPRCKLLIAKFALERFLASVDSLMSY
jgi:hypothetical protein